MTFLTFMAMQCLWWSKGIEVCKHEHLETTIRKSDITQLVEYRYYFEEETFRVAPNGDDFQPKVGATKMRGCAVTTERDSFKFAYPCKNFRKLLR